MNDGQALFEHLVSVLDASEGCITKRVASMASFLKSLHGEWAMVLFDPISEHLIFGRDSLGRRSLLWHFPSVVAVETEEEKHLNPYFILSSVGINVASSSGQPFWEEIPANGLYYCPIEDIKSEV